MDFKMDSVITNELFPGESIIWQGKPCQSKVFTKADIFLVPFSLLWGGFAVFWCIGATMAGGAFGLFGVPFVIVGLYFIFGRFIVKKGIKRTTTYAITNNRVIIVRTDSVGRKKSVSSAQIKSVAKESVSYDKNGTGTIIFGNAPYWQTMYLNSGMDLFGGQFQSEVIAFHDIEDCENVIRIYKDLKYQDI